MKLLRLALVLMAAIPFARAAAGDDEDQKQQQKPPTEIPDFSNLDEYIYQPKNTLNFGLRYISGAKTRFWGNGLINSPEALSNATAPDVSRTYHDGVVDTDTRTVNIDNGNGTVTAMPITPDGKTANWSYDSSGQLTSSGFMQFHLYSAATLDNAILGQKAKGNIGLELTSIHDIKDLGKHLSLKYLVGFGLSDIQSATMSNITARITTVTDTYDLFGQTPPSAPYVQTGSSSSSQSTSNSNTDANGSSVNQTVDTTTLIGSAPLSRTVSSAVDSTTVVDHWKLHGAYATLRAGPVLVYNFNDRLHLDVGLGVALLYAGTTYQVNEVLVAPTGGEIIDTLTDTTSRLLPGCYADATLQYDITDRTGLYFGAFFQDAGSYLQTAEATGGSTFGDATLKGTADYKTRVDFSGQEGFRTGLTFRF